MCGVVDSAAVLKCDCCGFKSSNLVLRKRQCILEGSLVWGNVQCGSVYTGAYNFFNLSMANKICNQAISSVCHLYRFN